jgi:hypothetical protein
LLRSFNQNSIIQSCNCKNHTLHTQIESAVGHGKYATVACRLWMLQHGLKLAAVLSRASSIPCWSAANIATNSDQRLDPNLAPWTCLHVVSKQTQLNLGALSNNQWRQPALSHTLAALRLDSNCHNGTQMHALCAHKAHNACICVPLWQACITLDVRQKDIMFVNQNRILNP